MHSSTRLSIFSALLVCGLWNRPAAAHPAWGIVIDSQGRVVVRVWRIAPDGSHDRVAVLGAWNRGVVLAGAGLAGALAVVLIASARRRAWRVRV